MATPLKCLSKINNNKTADKIPTANLENAQQVSNKRNAKCKGTGVSLSAQEQSKVKSPNKGQRSCN